MLQAGQIRSKDSGPHRISYSNVLYLCLTENPALEKQDTFVEKLVTQVIKNLQVKISNIHVRYEDDVSIQTDSHLSLVCIYIC